MNIGTSNRVTTLTSRQIQLVPETRNQLDVYQLVAGFQSWIYGYSITQSNEEREARYKVGFDDLRGKRRRLSYAWACEILTRTRQTTSVQMCYETMAGRSAAG